MPPASPWKGQPLPLLILAQDASHSLSSVAPLLFYPVALLAVTGALGVVLSQQVVRMAVWLLFALSAVAFLYFFLQAEFLAAIQLIVYVGGTLILIIFGVMLTSKNPFLRLTASRGERALGYLLGLCAAGLIAALALYGVAPEASQHSASLPAASAPANPFGIEQLGYALLSTYALPFEIAGILLLVVMVGAAYIAKGRHADPRLDLDSSEGGMA